MDLLTPKHIAVIIGLAFVALWLYKKNILGVQTFIG